MWSKMELLRLDYAEYSNSWKLYFESAHNTNIYNTEVLKILFKVLIIK